MIISSGSPEPDQCHEMKVNKVFGKLFVLVVVGISIYQYM